MGPAGTTYHQKTLTVDGTTSVIMTGNLVTADYPGTRDFAAIDTGRADVAAILATFNADFTGRAITRRTAPTWCGPPPTRKPRSCRSSTGCYRPRYLNIQRLNYLWTVRHSSTRIQAT
jgi:hypothetical protein